MQSTRSNRRKYRYDPRAHGKTKNEHKLYYRRPPCPTGKRPTVLLLYTCRVRFNTLAFITGKQNAFRLFSPTGPKPQKSSQIFSFFDPLQRQMCVCVCVLLIFFHKTIFNYKVNDTCEKLLLNKFVTINSIAVIIYGGLT